MVNDVAVPLDKVQTFLEQAEERVATVDPKADAMVVAHLGDGNVHYAVRVTDATLVTPVMETVEGLVRTLGGTFSAEHGIGRSKLGSMARRKDPVALDMMRAIKTALDPKGILNPGKLLPPA